MYAEPAYEEAGQQTVLSEETVWTEQKERRDRSSRTFLAEDGTEVTAFYPYPVFYQDGEGWSAYDYGLELVTGENETAYHVKKGSMETSLRRFYYDGEFLDVRYGEDGSGVAWSLPLAAGTEASLKEFTVEEGLAKAGEPQSTEKEETAAENTVLASEAETETEEETQEETEEETDGETETDALMSEEGMEAFTETEESDTEGTNVSATEGEETSEISTEQTGRETEKETEEEKLALEAMRSSGVYKEIQDGMDLGVTQWPGHVELSASFRNSVRAKQGLSFRLSLQGVSFTQAEDGSIHIVSGEGQTEEAVLRSPLICDGTRVLGTASYSLDAAEDGTALLSVVPDAEWMEDLERTSPITVKLCMVQTGMEEAFPAKIQGTEYYFEDCDMAAGNTLETVQTSISIPHKPQIPEGKYLYDAKLLLVREEIPDMQRKEMELGVYKKTDGDEFEAVPMDSSVYAADEETDVRTFDITSAFAEESDLGYRLLLRSVQTELVTGIYGFRYFVDDMLMPALLVSCGNEASSSLSGGNGGVDYSGIEEEESYIVGEDLTKRDEFTKHFLTEEGTYIAAVYEDPVHYEKNGEWEQIDNRLKLSEKDGNSTENEYYENTASDVNVEISRYSSSENLVSIQSEEGTISWGLVSGKETAQSQNAGQGLRGQAGTDSILGNMRKNASEFKVQTETENGESSVSLQTDETAPVQTEGAVTERDEIMADSAGETITDSAEETMGESESEQEPKFVSASGDREGRTVAEYNAEQMAVENLTAAGIYTDILPGVDIQYVLDSVNVKENIILKSRAAVQNEFSFRVHHPGMEMALSEDGSVTIKKAADEEVTPYTFMRPYMYDSDGITSTNVVYELTAEDKDTTVLTIRPDTNWLLEEGRSYPVTIDPVTETKRETKSIVDAFVREKQPTEAASGWGSFAVGYVPSYGRCRALVKFNNLPALEKGDLIYKGIFSVYQYKYDASAATSFTVTAHKPTGSWPTTVTWNTQPGCDTTVLDYKTVEPVADKFQPHLKQFDITSLVRSWYNTGVNNGIELRSSNETLRAEAYFITSNNSAFTTAAYPSGQFYYKNTAGVEECWSYHEQDAGRAGHGYTNDFNGNVVFTHQDTATTGNVLPVSVSHVYNLCEADKSSRFGNGWRLNVMQQLAPTAMEYFPYVYTDADGTKHYFYKDTNDGNKLKDEDGLGLTITQESSSNNDEYRIITCKDQSKMVFDVWGYLRRSIDTNGNTIRYNYGPNGNGNYLGNISDPTGAIIDFTYDSTYTRLTAITNRSTGRKTTYQYDSAGNLTSITYPDGKKSTYTYDAKKLTQAKAPDGYAIEYLYLMDFNVPRVRMFRERGTGNTIGRSVEVSYKNGNTTTFQYPGLDGDTTLRTDNPVYHYDFDNVGRPLTVYNDEGSANNYTYYKDGRKNNKLKESGALRASVSNYVLNPGIDVFGSAGVPDFKAYRTGSLAGYMAGGVSNTGYSGNTSIRVWGSSTGTGQAIVGQDISSLPAGTYTLSAYRKTANVSANTAGERNGAVFGVQFLSGEKNGQIEYSPETVTGTSNAGIDNGWQRVSVTFSVPQAGTNIRIFGGLNNASGDVYFDDFQLEKGSVPEGYNLAVNGGYESANSGTSGFNVWTVHNVSSGDGIVSGNAKFGSKSGRITGDPATRRYFRQEINVSGPEGDVYNLSGWAKANAVPGKEFRLGAEIRYSDGSRGWRYFEFDPYLTDWQFAGGMFTTDDNNSSTNLSYTCIIVHAFYGNQCNTAWFDGIQLTKDDGETYVYDSDGNLVSAKDAVEKDSFKFDQYGNLRSMTNITGSSFSFGYDDKQNLTWARNTDGLTYQFSYDSYGNPTSSKITGDEINDGPVSGQVYYLINKTSGKALDVNGGSDTNGTIVIQHTQHHGKNQQWKLVDMGDGYWKLVSQCGAGGHVLAVRGGLNEENAVVHMYADVGGPAQRWKLKRLNDGSYQIIAKCTNGTKCLTNYGGKTTNGHSMTSVGINGTHPDQSWYLEPVNPGNGISTFQTYTDKGRHTASVTDARGNTTTYSYDAKGRLLTGATDATGVTTSYTYDSNDRLTAVSRPLGGQTIQNGYTYVNDKLSAISHNDFSYQFVYDQWGNTSSVKVGDQTLSSQSLLPHDGPVSEKTYGNGDKVSYGYNKDELVTEIKYDGTTAFRYKYDDYGNEVEHSDVINNATYFFKYDSLGRPTLMRTTHGQELQIIYDSKNRTSKMVSAVNGTNTTTEYVYGNASSGQMPDMAYGIKIDGTQVLSYTYDNLCRTATRKLNLTAPYQTTYSFLQNPSGGETTFVSSVEDGGKTYTYAYDARGNITSVKEGAEEKLRYAYDDLDELVRVDDAYEGKTHTYTYDKGGNITGHSIYAYTTGELDGGDGEITEVDPETGGAAANISEEPEEIITYAYEDANWKDKLTSYNGQEITYDAIGNPLTYRDGMTFTWKHGRELATYTKDGNTYTYSYDEDGYRVKKKTGSTETIYYRNGSTLLTQKTGNDRLDFFYDENEQLLGFKDNGTKYYYTKNLQGDITGILDAAGNKVVEYTYDAWGKQLSCTGSKAETIGVKNPFRYRGYYYDAESGLYYLNSRYYDAVTGRFVNADSQLDNNAGLRKGNLFAYCANNPVMYKDCDGKFIISAIITVAVVGGLIGFAESVYTQQAESGTRIVDYKEATFSGIKGALNGIAMTVMPTLGTKIFMSVLIEAGGEFVYSGQPLTSQKRAEIIYTSAFSTVKGNYLTELADTIIPSPAIVSATVNDGMKNRVNKTKSKINKATFKTPWHGATVLKGYFMGSYKKKIPLVKAGGAKFWGLLGLR